MVLYTRKDTVASKTIYQGRIFDVHIDRLERDGNQIEREIVEHNGGVVIACQPAPGEVFLIKQYRYAVDQVLIELPAGRVDAGEDRLSAAKRELIEETGYKAESWHELPSMFSAPGFCTELLTFYLATNIEFVGKAPDHDEEIDVIRMSLKDAWDLVLNREIKDAKTVAALGIICHRTPLIEIFPNRSK